MINDILNVIADNKRFHNELELEWLQHENRVLFALLEARKARITETLQTVPEEQGQARCIDCGIPLADRHDGLTSRRCKMHSAAHRRKIMQFAV